MLDRQLNFLYLELAHCGTNLTNIKIYEKEIFYIEGADRELHKENRINLVIGKEFN